MKIFENIIVATIVVVVLGICLMTFEQVRSIGVSLLTSAGVAGYHHWVRRKRASPPCWRVCKLPLRSPSDWMMGHCGGWMGCIEEITLTYVVVKIWDERRLILPVTYFIGEAFFRTGHATRQRFWERCLYVDYALPVDALMLTADGDCAASP